MNYFELPKINGTLEQQVVQLTSYVYKLTEKLNVILSNLNSEKFVEEISTAMSADDTSETKYITIQRYINQIVNEISRSE